jgi:hypothetical protein
VRAVFQQATFRLSCGDRQAASRPDRLGECAKPAPLLHPCTPLPLCDLIRLQCRPIRNIQIPLLQILLSTALGGKQRHSRVSSTVDLASLRHLPTNPPIAGTAKGSGGTRLVLSHQSIYTGLVATTGRLDYQEAVKDAHYQHSKNGPKRNLLTLAANHDRSNPCRVDASKSRIRVARHSWLC